MKFVGLFILSIISFCLKTNIIHVEEETITVEKLLVADIKKDAFKVLENKCNNCHQKKKRLTIFTLDNMDVFAPLIHTQVIVEKRMPKGRIKLTLMELTALSEWLKVTLDAE